MSSSDHHHHQPDIISPWQLRQYDGKGRVQVLHPWRDQPWSASQFNKTHHNQHPPGRNNKIWLWIIAMKFNSWCPKSYRPMSIHLRHFVPHTLHAPLPTSFCFYKYHCHFRRYLRDWWSCSRKEWILFLCCQCMNFLHRPSRNDFWLVIHSKISSHLFRLRLWDVAPVSS